MSFLLHPVSDLFHRTIDEDVREIMGQDVVMCSGTQTTIDVNRHIDLLTCLLLQHSKMKLKELASIISTIMKMNVLTYNVACRIVVLNNGKHRICFDRDKQEYSWNWD